MRPQKLRQYLKYLHLIVVAHEVQHVIEIERVRDAVSFAKDECLLERLKPLLARFRRFIARAAHAGRARRADDVRAPVIVELAGWSGETVARGHRGARGRAACGDDFSM